MSSPWKALTPPAQVHSLSDIMLEEYLRTTQLKADAFIEQHSSTFHSTEHSQQALIKSEYNEIITKMLQCKLDKQNNEIKGAAKELCSSDEKLPLIINYNNIHPLTNTNNIDSDSNDEATDEDASNDWEYFEPNEKDFAWFPKQGHGPKDERLIIKHDIINSRRIASSILDERTRRILCKLINDNIIEGINGVISVGKESIILHARPIDKFYVKEYAIKVFKTTRSKSSPRNKRIKDELGFKTCQELAYIKAEKEYRTGHIYLLAEKEYRTGHIYFLDNPSVYYHVDHVIVMCFIGENEKPAPHLQDAILTPNEWQSAYDQVAVSVQKLYHIGRLIHGHLIKNHVMWWNKKCWFINFSQSVHRDHPKAYKVLLRDCQNICNFFKKKGVQNMKTKEELFEWITGFEVAHFGKP